MDTQETKLQPRIYVACLSAYCDGYLHGEWLDPTNGIDQLRSDVKSMLTSSPSSDAEEWAIHDFEDFGGIQIDEYTCFETITKYCDFIKKHGELGTEVMGHISGTIEQAEEVLENNYQGEFNSEEDFAIYFTEEINCYHIPKYLRFYIDYEKMARDLFINDFFSIELNHKIHVFNIY